MRGPVLNKWVEVMRRHASGREIPIQMSIAAFHDGSGDIATALLRNTPKAAEDHPRQKKRLRAIAENLPVLISYIDRSRCFGLPTLRSKSGRA